MQGRSNKPRARFVKKKVQNNCYVDRAEEPRIRMALWVNLV